MHSRVRVLIRTHYCRWKPPADGPQTTSLVVSSNGFPVYGRRRILLQLAPTEVITILLIYYCIIYRVRGIFHDFRDPALPD